MAVGPSRKLAVILHADVVGSTRLVQQNEALAHARIQDAFRRFSSTIEAYGGVTHELRGDALVAEFARASDAVSAALAFQIENTESNARLEDDLQPRLRIGISLGEVVIADNTVTGAGVVLAQRVEQLAEPGGVCITGAIHEAVPKYLPLDYSDLGKREAKGFDESVHVYSATVKAGKQVPPPEPAVSEEAHPLKPKRVWTAGAIALLVLVVVGLAWWQPWVPREELASIERMAFPLPDKPSIAVLPFTNMSDDPKQEYFVDGITEDLITDLSKLSGLFVVARNSTFTYKGKAVKVRQVAEELGVRYVLEGSVRFADSYLRINAQLIDTTTGGHVWAERYDSTLNDIFAVQDKVTQDVVNALAVRLTEDERETPGGAETDSTEAYQAFLQGRAQLELRNKEGFARAIPHFEQALQLDPNYSRVYGALAEVYWYISYDGYSGQFGMSREESRFKMAHYLAEAMKSPNPTYRTLYIQSMYLTLAGLWEEAVAATEQMIAASPSEPTGYRALGRAANYAGRPAQGLDAVTKARRLNPRGDDAGAYAELIGQSLFLLGRYEEAEDEYLKYVKRSGDDYWGSMMLAGIYGQLGRKEEAKAALDTFNERRAESGYSPFTLATFDKWDFAPSVREVYVESLRKAGMPPRR